jgi:hypothetical protein
MNDFGFLDIYATKNLEYLWVVVFLAVFAVAAWLLVRSEEGRR